MRSVSFLTTAAVAISMSLAGATSLAENKGQPKGEEIPSTPPAAELPDSEFLSEETRAVLKRQAADLEAYYKVCPLKHTDITNAEQAIAWRTCFDEHYYPALLARHRVRYKVDIERKTIAGVPTEIITPSDGVPAGNRERVLINLHGGGYIMGGRWGGQVESIPIAAVGRIKVVSVDYRMAPEHRFPAASEDAAKVYRALLRDYRPESIGVYGCSAGGLLTAQLVAWLQHEGLPRPGAVGMFCLGALWYERGDSNSFMAGAGPSVHDKIAYHSAVDRNNPLAFPAIDPRVMEKFPPSLLISSSRDFMMSSVVSTHAQLVRLGVDADLHLWEGLGHAFFFEPDLPESREVYDVIGRFFNARLGD